MRLEEKNKILREHILQLSICLNWMWSNDIACIFDLADICLFSLIFPIRFFHAFSSGSNIYYFLLCSSTFCSLGSNKCHTVLFAQTSGQFWKQTFFFHPALSDHCILQPLFSLSFKFIIIWYSKGQLTEKGWMNYLALCTVVFFSIMWDNNHIFASFSTCV